MKRENIFDRPNSNKKFELSLQNSQQIPAEKLQKIDFSQILESLQAGIKRSAFSIISPKQKAKQPQEFLINELSTVQQGNKSYYDLLKNLLNNLDNIGKVSERHFNIAISAIEKILKTAEYYQSTETKKAQVRLENFKTIKKSKNEAERKKVLEQLKVDCKKLIKLRYTALLVDEINYYNETKTKAITFSRAINDLMTVQCALSSQPNTDQFDQFKTNNTKLDKVWDAAANNLKAKNAHRQNIAKYDPYKIIQLNEPRDNGMIELFNQFVEIENNINKKINEDASLHDACMDFRPKRIILLARIQNDPDIPAEKKLAFELLGLITDYNTVANSRGRLHPTREIRKQQVNRIKNLCDKIIESSDKTARLDIDLQKELDEIQHSIASEAHFLGRSELLKKVRFMREKFYHHQINLLKQTYKDTTISEDVLKQISPKNESELITRYGNKNLELVKKIVGKFLNQDGDGESKANQIKLKLSKSIIKAGQQITSFSDLNEKLKQSPIDASCTVANIKEIISETKITIFSQQQIKLVINKLQEAINQSESLRRECNSDQNQIKIKLNQILNEFVNKCFHNACVQCDAIWSVLHGNGLFTITFNKHLTTTYPTADYEQDNNKSWGEALTDKVLLEFLSYFNNAKQHDYQTFTKNIKRLDKIQSQFKNNNSIVSQIQFDRKNIVNIVDKYIQEYLLYLLENKDNDVNNHYDNLYQLAKANNGIILSLGNKNYYLDEQLKKCIRYKKNNNDVLEYEQEKQIKLEKNKRLADYFYVALKERQFKKKFSQVALQSEIKADLKEILENKESKKTIFSLLKDMFDGVKRQEDNTIIFTGESDCATSEIELRKRCRDELFSHIENDPTRSREEKIVYQLWQALADYKLAKRARWFKWSTHSSRDKQVSELEQLCRATIAEQDPSKKHDAVITLQKKLHEIEAEIVRERSGLGRLGRQAFGSGILEKKVIAIQNKFYEHHKNVICTVLEQPLVSNRYNHNDLNKKDLLAEIENLKLANKDELIARYGRANMERVAIAARNYLVAEIKNGNPEINAATFKLAENVIEKSWQVNWYSKKLVGELSDALSHSNAMQKKIDQIKALKVEYSNKGIDTVVANINQISKDSLILNSSEKLLKKQLKMQKIRHKKDLNTFFNQIVAEYFVDPHSMHLEKKKLWNVIAGSELFAVDLGKKKETFPSDHAMGEKLTVNRNGEQIKKSIYELLIEAAYSQLERSEEKTWEFYERCFKAIKAFAKKYANDSSVQVKDENILNGINQLISICIQKVLANKLDNNLLTKIFLADNDAHFQYSEKKNCFQAAVLNFAKEQTNNDKFSVEDREKIIKLFQIMKSKKMMLITDNNQIKILDNFIASYFKKLLQADHIENYPLKILAEKGKIAKKGKNQGIYLHRFGEPEQILVSVVDHKGDVEELNMGDLVEKAKAPSLTDNLIWPNNEEGDVLQNKNRILELVTSAYCHAYVEKIQTYFELDNTQNICPKFGPGESYYTAEDQLLICLKEMLPTATSTILKVLPNAFEYMANKRANVSQEEKEGIDKKINAMTKIIVEYMLNANLENENDKNRIALFFKNKLVSEKIIAYCSEKYWSETKQVVLQSGASSASFKLAECIVKLGNDNQRWRMHSKILQLLATLANEQQSAGRINVDDFLNEYNEILEKTRYQLGVEHIEGLFVKIANGAQRFWSNQIEYLQSKGQEKLAKVLECFIDRENREKVNNKILVKTQVVEFAEVFSLRTLWQREKFETLDKKINCILRGEPLENVVKNIINSSTTEQLKIINTAFQQRDNEIGENWNGFSALSKQLMRTCEQQFANSELRLNNGLFYINKIIAEMNNKNGSLYRDYEWKNANIVFFENVYKTFDSIDRNELKKLFFKDGNVASKEAGPLLIAIDCVWKNLLENMERYEQLIQAEGVGKENNQYIELLDNFKHFIDLINDKAEQNVWQINISENAKLCLEKSMRTLSIALQPHSPYMRGIETPPNATTKLKNDLQQKAQRLTITNLHAMQFKLVQCFGSNENNAYLERLLQKITFEYTLHTLTPTKSHKMSIKEYQAYQMLLPTEAESENVQLPNKKIQYRFRYNEFEALAAFSADDVVQKCGELRYVPRKHNINPGTKKRDSKGHQNACRLRYFEEPLLNRVLAQFENLLISKIYVETDELIKQDLQDILQECKQKFTSFFQKIDAMTLFNIINDQRLSSILNDSLYKDTVTMLVLSTSAISKAERKKENGNDPLIRRKIFYIEQLLNKDKIKLAEIELDALMYYLQKNKLNLTEINKQNLSSIITKAAHAAIVYKNERAISILFDADGMFRHIADMEEKNKLIDLLCQHESPKVFEQLKNIMTCLQNDDIEGLQKYAYRNEIISKEIKIDKASSYELSDLFIDCKNKFSDLENGIKNPWAVTANNNQGEIKRELAQPLLDKIDEFLNEPKFSTLNSIFNNLKNMLNTIKNQKIYAEMTKPFIRIEDIDHTNSSKFAKYKQVENVAYNSKLIDKWFTEKVNRHYLLKLCEKLSAEIKNYKGFVEGDVLTQPKITAFINEISVKYPHIISINDLNLQIPDDLFANIHKDYILKFKQALALSARLINIKQQLENMTDQTASCQALSRITLELHKIIALNRDIYGKKPFLSSTICKILDKYLDVLKMAQAPLMARYNQLLEVINGQSQDDVSKLNPGIVQFLQINYEDDLILYSGKDTDEKQFAKLNDVFVSRCRLGFSVKDQFFQRTKSVFNQFLSKGRGDRFLDYLCKQYKNKSDEFVDYFRNNMCKLVTAGFDFATVFAEKGIAMYIKLNPDCAEKEAMYVFIKDLIVIAGNKYKPSKDIQSLFASFASEEKSKFMNVLFKTHATEAARFFSNAVDESVCQKLWGIFDSLDLDDKKNFIKNMGENSTASFISNYLSQYMSQIDTKNNLEICKHLENVFNLCKDLEVTQQTVVNSFNEINISIIKPIVLAEALEEEETKGVATVASNLMVEIDGFCTKPNIDLNQSIFKQKPKNHCGYLNGNDNGYNLSQTGYKVKCN